jgi:glycosyltransferase involved in cell wall biosynthesis
MKYRKVLITSFFPRHVGGLQSHVDLLVSCLESKGLKVVHFQRLSRRISLFRKAALWVQSGFKRERALLQFWVEEMNRFVESLKPLIKDVELVHCHDAFSAFCLRNVALPLVLTVHGPLTPEHQMMGWKDKESLERLEVIEEEAYNRANAVIAVDNGHKKYVVDNFGIPESKVHVIRNAVDVQKIVELSQNENYSFQKIENVAPFVLVPRRLVPKNGVAVAVKAMHFLKDLDLKLVIAGDGPERHRLVDLVRNLGLQDRVIFLGTVDHEAIFPLLRHAHMVVVPSIPVSGVVEATSIAALEAMALGKVVIASNVGGLREIIVSGVDGFLFEPGNEEELAKIMRDCFFNETLKVEIERKAREKILSSYDVTPWISAILSVYDEAVRQ